jgi:gamma-glutamylcyclotransferase (GGCT)/AIG2-like uncharacterized protein YtfP
MKLTVFALIGLITISMFTGLLLVQAQTKTDFKEIVFPSWGNNAPEIAIIVKGDWKEKTNKGPDFDIHYLTLNTNGDSIAIYVGNNPQSLVKTNATTTNVNIGTKQATFYVTQRDGVSQAEAIIDGLFSGFEGSGVAELRLHIMVNAKSSEKLAEIFKYIETLKLIDRK